MDFDTAMSNARAYAKEVIAICPSLADECRGLIDLLELEMEDETNAPQHEYDSFQMSIDEICEKNGVKPVNYKVRW